MPEQTRQLPSNVSDSLRELWTRALGAGAAAGAAQQVAKSLMDTYQAKFADCLAILGCDPTAKWWIDFRTGQVHEGEPPSEPSNGSPAAQQPLSVRPEGNAVQTNGRAT